MSDNAAGWLAALAGPGFWIEIAALAACLGLAWVFVSVGRRKLRGGVWFGQRGFDGVLFPLLAWAAALLAQLMLLRAQRPIALFAIALPVLTGLAIVRVTVRVLQVAFPGSVAIGAFSRALAWGVWIVLALWLTDLLPLVLSEMEKLHWKIGGGDVTLRGLVEGALTAMAVLLAVLWLSASIESRLMGAANVSISARKMASKATRAALLLVGLLIALSAAGIPLGALSVLGGAVGVGLGFGLQKLAANYVSGFVILAERSLRIGDVVKVDNFEGRITDIATRYTVIRALNGRESIVPNELLITQRVENCSFADRNVALTTVVQVAYGSNLDALIPALAQAVSAVPRVLADPAVNVQLSQFAADGLELTIVFWIADPEYGHGNVRSDVNLALLRAIGEAGVEIPFPQRVLRRARPG